jgi:hypothetical protein
LDLALTTAPVLVARLDLALTIAPVLVARLDLALTKAPVLLTRLDLAITTAPALVARLDLALTTAPVLLARLDIAITTAPILVARSDLAITTAPVWLPRLDLAVVPTALTLLLRLVLAVSALVLAGGISRFEFVSSVLWGYLDRSLYFPWRVSAISVVVVNVYECNQKCRQHPHDRSPDLCNRISRIAI